MSFLELSCFFDDDKSVLAAMNFGVHVSLSILVSLVCMLSSGNKHPS